MDSVLIANRGEIACRVIRACHELGLRAMAVYSDADRDALHVRLADAAYRLGPAPASESYLNAEAVLVAARRSGADAVHPGYGFLAEEAVFAAAVQEAGLVWIGPPPAAMALMGNKQAARERAAALGVQIVPGFGGPDQRDERFTAEAVRLGFPLLVKAAAGGGGKGMRRVPGADQLPAALAAARREARQAFGSEELLLEKALAAPRHVEIQILADAAGHTVALGERDCSCQRRYQKIVEESPAPGLADPLRQGMVADAITLARAVGYVNAGTVEFLVDGDAYYFLEMNTRLQVEHPVTELRYGVDLVQWQLRIALGELLTGEILDTVPQGHAMEVRLYAEDPARAFMPSSGTLGLWRAPELPGVRVDHGVCGGDVVTVHYDPLLAKIIAHGRDRATAVRRLRQALEHTVALGVTHNRDFLLAVVTHPAFAAGGVTTDWLEQVAWTGAESPPGGDLGHDLRWPLAAATLAGWSSLPRASGGAGFWRNNPNAPISFRFQVGRSEGVEEVQVQSAGSHTFRLNLLQQKVTAELILVERDAITLAMNGERRTIACYQDGTQWWLQGDLHTWRLEALPRWPEPEPPAAAGGSLRAPMPGTVSAVLVGPGDSVTRGQPLLILEAMKMEHTIRSAADGVIEAIHFAAGEKVDADSPLLVIRPDSA